MMNKGLLSNSAYSIIKFEDQWINLNIYTFLVCSIIDYWLTVVEYYKSSKFSSCLKKSAEWKRRIEFKIVYGQNKIRISR